MSFARRRAGLTDHLVFGQQLLPTLAAKNLSFLYQGPYVGVPVVGCVSKGDSNRRSLVAIGGVNSPTAGTLIKQWAPMLFVPSTFDPTLESPTGWWEADSVTGEYDGVPWAATASAGTSATNGSLATGGNTPTAGTAQNGHVPARIDSASSQSFNPTSAATTSLISVSTGTIIALFKTHSTVATTGNFYDDPAVITDLGGNLALTITSSGVQMGAFVGANRQTTALAFGAGAYHMAAGRFDGSGNVDCCVDSTHATPVAMTGNVTLNATTLIGKNYTSAKYVDISLLALLTFQTRLSDAKLDQYRTGYFNTKYGLSL